jgi:hypothetical protein
LIIQCKERFCYLPHLVLNKEIRSKARTPWAAESGSLSVGFYAGQVMTFVPDGFPSQMI